MNTLIPKERSGFRDEKLSKRHRMYGWDCGAQDIDFIEYHHFIPKALIEHKHERSRIQDQDPNSCQCKVLANLGDMSRLPAFLAIYNDKFEYDVCPLNDLARKTLKDWTHLPEQRYVAFLYYLRGLKLTNEMWQALKEKEEYYMSE